MEDRFKFVTNKITDITSLQRTIAGWRLKGDRVVFTNGCFDILHKGHVTYLAKAASLGERLVVALNTDDSVRRLGKDDNRPINEEDARAMVLASLGFVDGIVFFNEDTPLETIVALEPDVLVKGADYDPEETNPDSKKYIVGSKEVRSNGGRVEAIDLVQGFSTTAIIEKSKN
ncbi:MAG: D-glycero-beta-D-manno-heptose 1-phosphate adenylyltransferase [Fluviicola sp. XM-24bin1]|nr:MAG: D-glycero-beta-D-manno-heptose 1-phosphate adenylyltransferase [Fluviicola sp. XM-24bin1]